MERLPGDSEVAGDDGLGDPRTDAGFRVTDLFDSESGLLRIRYWTSGQVTARLAAAAREGAKSLQVRKVSQRVNNTRTVDRTDQTLISPIG